jgi:hypothetical protein
VQDQDSPCSQSRHFYWRDSLTYSELIRQALSREDIESNTKDQTRDTEMFKLRSYTTW